MKFVSLTMTEPELYMKNCFPTVRKVYKSLRTHSEEDTWNADRSLERFRIESVSFIEFGHAHARE